MALPGWRVATARSPSSSGSPTYPDDGQMRPVIETAEHQREPHAAFALHRRGRPRTSRVPRPQRARLVPGRFVRRWQTPVHFDRRASSQRGVRSMLVVPGRVAAELVTHRAQPERHDDLPRAFALHRPDEALDDRDAAVLPHRAVPRSDPLSAAPVLERPAEELLPLVRDDCLGFEPVRRIAMPRKE